MTSSPDTDERGRRRFLHGENRRSRILGGAACVAAMPLFLFGCSSSSTSSTTSSVAANTSAVPFTAATVTGSGSDWKISWVAPGTSGVRVFEGSSATDTPTAVGSGQSSGTLTAVRTPGVSRAWFRLVPSKGTSLVLAERDLGLTTDPNLRDVGGYRTASGDWVRMGLVYRSQALHPLSATDLAAIDQLGITDIYDLRTPAEASGSPDATVSGATYHLVNVFGTPGPVINAGTTSTSAQQSMIEMNVHFVTGAPDRAALKQLITDLADSTGPQLFNCTAGKDRTGWATAVILSTLGVPESTVMQDYLLSNRYYFDSPSVQSSIKSASPSQAAVSTAILDVNARYLQAGLDQMKKSYGSAYNYMVQGLGVSPATVAKLRARLLVT
jgi:protein-tyrosine phosphatase